MEDRIKPQINMKNRNLYKIEFSYEAITELLKRGF